MKLSWLNLYPYFEQLQFSYSASTHLYLCHLIPVGVLGGAHSNTEMWVCNTIFFFPKVLTWTCALQIMVIVTTYRGNTPAFFTTRFVYFFYSYFRKCGNLIPLSNAAAEQLGISSVTVSMACMVF